MDTNRELMKEYTLAVLHECGLMHDSGQIDHTRWLLRVETGTDTQGNRGYYLVDDSEVAVEGSFFTIGELGRKYSEEAIERRVEENRETMLDWHKALVAHVRSGGGDVPEFTYKRVAPVSDRIMRARPEQVRMEESLGLSPARQAAIHEKHTRTSPVEDEAAPDLGDPAPALRPVGTAAQVRKEQPERVAGGTPKQEAVTRRLTREEDEAEARRRASRHNHRALLLDDDKPQDDNDFGPR